MDEWMDGWVDGWMDGWMGGWVCRWICAWVGGIEGGSMEGQADGRIFVQCIAYRRELQSIYEYLRVCVCVCVKKITVFGRSYYVIIIFPMLSRR